MRSLFHVSVVGGASSGGGGRRQGRRRKWWAEGYLDVVVDALQKQLALVGEQLPPLGRSEGPHQRLEQVGAPIIMEQHPELHLGKNSTQLHEPINGNKI